MENVLYAIRNGKIVYPEIPTEGLVCYLDARGKKNTDIYKNVLLDLSGNGNDGTLENFNFSESSGYSAEGLKFDGVDDRVGLNHTQLTDKTKSKTILLEFELKQTATELGENLYIIDNFYIHQVNNKIYPINEMVSGQTGGNIYFEKVMKKEKYQIIYRIDVNNRTRPDMWVNGEKITLFNLDNKRMATLNVSQLALVGKKKISKLIVWNRTLSDTEIQQLQGE